LKHRVSFVIDIIDIIVIIVDVVVEIIIDVIEIVEIIIDVIDIIVEIASAIVEDACHGPDAMHLQRGVLVAIVHRDVVKNCVLHDVHTVVMALVGLMLSFAPAAQVIGDAHPSCPGLLCIQSSTDATFCPQRI